MPSNKEARKELVKCIELLPLASGVALTLAMGCSPANGSEGNSGTPPETGVANDSTFAGSGSSGAGDVGEIEGGAIVDPGIAGEGEGVDMGCGSDRAETTPLPVDLMILLDQSGSMTLDSPNRWNPVTQAMKGFFSRSDLENMRLGIQYFPLGASTTEDPAICLPANYESPEVPFTLTPEGGAQVSASIDAHYFTAAEGRDAAHWGTPTRPALEGTYSALRSYLASNPESNPILVLATDGRPSKLCYDEEDDLDGISEITEVIAEAASGAQPIRTYVIGIGEIDRLDEWAMAGGTGRGAFVVDAGDPVATEREFADAMDEIRKAEVPCSYPIPAPSGGAIDFQKLNVEFSSSLGEVEGLAQVSGASACTGGLDWFYDDPASPALVNLCPQSCESINERGGKVELVFGCKTNLR